VGAVKVEGPLVTREEITSHSEMMERMEMWLWCDGKSWLESDSGDL